MNGIETRTAQGVSTNGRLNPEGETRPTGQTRFVLTGKQTFPNEPLRVEFRSALNANLRLFVDIPVDAASRPSPNQLAGLAPPNNQYVGDVHVLVFNVNGDGSLGKKISKDKTGGALYYAFDPPSPATGVSPDGFNRLGGLLTITAQGGGFRQFRPSPDAPPTNPIVKIGGIDFGVNTVNDSQINGLVERASADEESCANTGQVPCKRVRVTNPGGRAQDRVFSIIPLYNLKPGPPPLPQSRFPDFGLSIGGQLVTIKGENLDFTDNVTIGGTDAPIIEKTRKTLLVSTLPHTASGSPVPITLFDIDNAAPSGTQVPGGGFRYDPTQVTQVFDGPVRVFIVGPGEGVAVRSNSISVSGNITCIRDSLSLSVNSVLPPRPPIALPGVSAFKVSGSADCATCQCNPSTQVGCAPIQTGTVRFTLANTAAAMNDALTRNITVTLDVPFWTLTTTPPTCSLSF